VGDPVVDVFVEFAHGAVCSPAELLVGQLCEPALDEVQPRRAGRGEVQMEPWVREQPALNRLCLVGRVVVEDQVNVLVVLC